MAARSPASPLARNTMLFAICATSHPIAAAASAAVRVPSGKARMSSGCPAARSAARTRATDSGSISIPMGRTI